jgi:deoxyribonuclease-4
MILLGPAGLGPDAIKGLNSIKDKGLDAAEVEFTHGVRMTNERAREIGSIAKILGIRLSVHCPYFINLCSEKEEVVIASKARILQSAERAHHLQAGPVVFHPGYIRTRMGYQALP